MQILSKIIFLVGYSRDNGFEFTKQYSETKPTASIAPIRDERRPKTYIELISEHSNIKIVTIDTSNQSSIEKPNPQLEEVSPEGIDTIVFNNGIH